jgi:glycosyltransferase involved in cell wall biosynthesis
MDSQTFSSENNLKHAPIRILMMGAGLDVMGGITSVEKLILDNIEPPFQIRHVATFAQGSALHNIFIFLNAFKVLLLGCLKNEVDIIHIHFSEWGSTLRKLVLLPVPILFRKPLILHCHGAAYREFFSSLPRSVQSLISWLFRKCYRFIALSQTWKDYYAEQFKLSPSQIFFLRNPVKAPDSVPLRTERPNVTIVFLGRIGERSGALDVAKSVMAFPRQDKGAFDLIRAFADIPEVNRGKVKLILAGNGDLDSAQSLIHELGLDLQVSLRTWLNAKQRDALLAEADVFVLPSYNEGLPMSVLEAMAWELPVITTPVGGIPEVINHKENGLLVQPGVRVELIEAMQDLIGNEDLRHSLGKAAREYVRTLDISHYISSLTDVYFSVATPSQD